MEQSVGPGAFLKRLGRRILGSRPLVSSIFGTIVTVVFAGGIAIGSGIATQIPVDMYSRQVATDLANSPKVGGAGAPIESDQFSKRADTATQRAPEPVTGAQAPAPAAPALDVQPPAASAATTAPAKPAEAAKPAETISPQPAAAKPATSDSATDVRSTESVKPMAPAPMKPGSTPEREASTSNSSAVPPSTSPPFSGSSAATRSEAPTTFADASSTSNSAQLRVEPTTANLPNKNVRGKASPIGSDDPSPANVSIPRPGITGKVIGIIENTVLVRTRLGATVQVQINSNTVLRRQGRPANASEIMIGDPIVVIGRVSANDRRLNAALLAVDPP